MTFPDSPDAEMRSFVRDVQAQADLKSTADAERACRATVSALGERLTARQAEELGSGLPENLEPSLTRHSGKAQRFDAHEFLDKVSGEIGSVDEDEVETEVKAVLHTIREWAPRRQVETTIAQLPGDLAAMFR
ncbi:DUF2267 domain-containing protein [Saccharopolyspora sp. HNM0983]|uniref:DUF2267 domain-containing protein n=1 Tax=Saccharopolyspora montiporae TaxID=2781240 RepID=A0A929G168_9PSEU|nr:DUF2267 domain-containing protein [Saccharopolyspora sp. HNM0983]MBE9376014.1 DUF2267 domain-containing protein [Saccharopolyspora sp. HNM0983]